jgi:hypothetical protein
MPIERSYRMLAYSFRVIAPRPLASFLRRFLAPFEAAVGSGASVYELREEPGAEKPWVMDLDGRSLHRGRTPSRILEFALWDANTKAIGSDHGCFAVHAAAASLDGSAVLLPAPPDSGKSTLVAGLTRAGFAYLTDEAALIDPADGRLRPFPRSLWLGKDSLEAVFGAEASAMRWATGRQFHVRPRDLRPRAIGRACPVGLVVAPRFEPEVATTLEPVGRAEAVMILAENAFHLDRFGGAGIELLGRVVENARCYRLRFADLDEAVGAILDVVREPALTVATERGLFR